MSNHPVKITGAKVEQLYLGLGLDPGVARLVREVLITPGVIEVVMYREDASGRLVHSGDRLVEERTEIAVDWTTDDGEQR